MVQTELGKPGTNELEMNSLNLHMKVFCEAPSRIGFSIRHFKPPDCPHTLYNTMIYMTQGI